MLKDDLSLPATIETLIESKKRDFSVKANHKQPLKESLKPIIFSIFFIIFGCVFWTALLSTDMDIVSTILLLSFMGVFIWGGAMILRHYGLYPALQRGWYFIGTRMELLHYHNKKLESIPWTRMAGTIEVIIWRNQRGSITLSLKNNESNDENTHEDDPDFIYMTDIPDVIEIAKLCLQRINENNKAK